MYLMEPAGADDELEREEEEDCEEVEGRLVCEYGVGFDSFEG